MKGMPLPLDFEGKGVLEFAASNISSSSASTNPLGLEKWDISIIFSSNKKDDSFIGSEPTSVLDTIRSPSPPSSTSTVSSSLGGGGGGGGSCSTDTAGVAAVSGNPSQKCPPPQQETTSSSNVGVESGCESLDIQRLPPSLEIGGNGNGGNASGTDKCGLGMEDWESVLTGSVAPSSSQEQSILRWILGDVEDPSMGLNKVLQMGGSVDLDFNGGGFDVDAGVAADTGFGLDSIAGQLAGSCGGNANLMPPINTSTMTSSDFSCKQQFNNEKICSAAANPSSNLLNFKLTNLNNPMFSSLPSNLSPVSLAPSSFSQTKESPQLQTPFQCSDVKPQIFNPQVLSNQHQTQHTQNMAFFLPSSHTKQEQHLPLPPQANRHNPESTLESNHRISKAQFLDSGQELFSQGLPYQLQMLPHYLQQRPAAMEIKPKLVGDELGHCNQEQQAIIDQLYKAAELVQTANPALAQGILARLNHQLSPIGKPFHRAAFYCKEALQLLIHTINSSNTCTATLLNSSPFSLIFKIGAYKYFSEISPFFQFANFTCNQAILEVVEGFDQIHIVDFDIGYGGQWASLMQELASRSGGLPLLKITAFASPLTYDQLELSLIRENLMHFACEINLAFEFEIVSIDSLNSASWSLPLHVSENKAVAVNLPIVSLFNYQLSLPLVLRFIRQLSPKIVVSVDRGCDRTDLSFPNQVIHALHFCSNLLESLDAVHVNLDSLQKVERFLLQPGIEKIVMGRYHPPERTQHWRTLFLSFGLSPLTFSNFSESQAECLVKRMPVRGFHVEKRQSSLVLCWQQKDLISASAWRC